MFQLHVSETKQKQFDAQQLKEYCMIQLVNLVESHVAGIWSGDEALYFETSFWISPSLTSGMRVDPALRHHRYSHWRHAHVISAPWGLGWRALSLHTFTNWLDGLPFCDAVIGSRDSNVDIISWILLSANDVSETDTNIRLKYIMNYYDLRNTKLNSCLSRYANVCCHAPILNYVILITTCKQCCPI